MMPPASALWVLRHCLTGPHADAVVGDLIETFHHHPSALWFWRQAIGAIAVQAARDASTHWRLTILTVLTGSAVLVPWIYLTIAAHRGTSRFLSPLITRPEWWDNVVVRVAWWAWWIYVMPLLAAWFGASLLIGWTIARTHREHWLALVLASVIFQLPWALLWAWPAWRSATMTAGTDYMIPNLIVGGLTLIGIPFCTLLGGFSSVARTRRWAV
jgi:hypothetical protein